MVSSSLLWSIKTKHKIYKSICKTYEETKYKSYKKYRNVLNRTIEKAKQKSYNELIIENKSDSGKIWKIVNELVDLKPSQQVDINQLNTKVSAEIISEVDANDINATAPKGMINSFFLTPTYPNEINNIIDSFKDSKATRCTDAKTKFMKISKSIISPFLYKLINNCFRKTSIQTAWKLPKLFQFLKRMIVEKFLNLTLAHFTILARSLARLNYLYQPHKTLIHSRSSLLTRYRHWWERH